MGISCIDKSAIADEANSHAYTRPEHLRKLGLVRSQKRTGVALDIAEAVDRGIIKYDAALDVCDADEAERMQASGRWSGAVEDGQPCAADPGRRCLAADVPEEATDLYQGNRSGGP